MATRFPCPNCGGQLRYSPEKAQLSCTSCNSLFDVEEYKPDDGIGIDNVNTNLFICPTCGGEIQLIDNDGMAFCPFCGNQATMQESFSSKGTPKFILPFTYSKKDVKNQLSEYTKGIHFIPDGLLEQDNIDKIVSMYVPYYLYNYQIDKTITYDGVKSYSTTDYYITDKAEITVGMRVGSMMVPYDASQGLDDSIACLLEPFPMHNLKTFNPNYLAGAFVENSSVDLDLYEEEASNLVVDKLIQKASFENHGFKCDYFEGIDEIRGQIENGVKETDIHGAYFPFYFLTSKCKDRVSYSIINGTNGTVYTDIPIDKRKLFTVSLVVSIVTFIVLIGFSYLANISYQAKGLCGISAFISGFISMFGGYLANSTYKKDNHIEDKGFFVSKRKFHIDFKKICVNLYSIITTCILLGLVIGITGLVIDRVRTTYDYTGIFSFMAGTGFMIIAIFLAGFGSKRTIFVGFLGWAMAAFTRWLDFPEDIFYYGALSISAIVIFVSINEIVDQYNRFSTHCLPQFAKKGGGLENA